MHAGKCWQALKERAAMMRAEMGQVLSQGQQHDTREIGINVECALRVSVHA